MKNRRIPQSVWLETAAEMRRQKRHWAMHWRQTKNLDALRAAMSARRLESLVMERAAA